MISLQNSWYAWQTRRIWNEAWNECHPMWSRPWQAFVEEFQAVYDQFLIHARNDPQQFQTRGRDLYQPRAGLTYLLPVASEGIEGLYRAVLAGLKEYHSENLPPDAHEGQVLNRILGSDGWATVFAAGRRDPNAVLAMVRQKTREAVFELVRRNDRDRPALIPTVENLLADAPERLREELEGLLLDGALVPDGNAPLKVLVSYPGTRENEDVEQFLRRTVSFPADMIGKPEFRAVQTDSITVVLIRTSMSVTEVPELRRVVSLWAEAHRRPRPQDILPWRRRLSQNAGYVLMTEADRTRVLHSLLCAAWNGTLVTAGNPASPDHIVVGSGTRKSGRIKLELAPLGALSSWASVLQAYEHWLLEDDNPAKPRLAARLMASGPRLSSPAAEFSTLVDLATTELPKINEPAGSWLLSRDLQLTVPLLSGDPQLTVFREFWSHDLPVALHQPIGLTSSSLFDLYGHAKPSGEEEPPMPEESPKVFLSYAREDAAQADRLYRGLVDHGIRVWKDDHDLLPGESWEDKIVRIVAEYEFAVLCLSRQALTKRGFFQVELKLTARVQQERPVSDIYMIPAKIDAQLRHQDLPREIAALHVVDLTAGWDRGVEKIVTAVRRYQRPAVS